MAGVFRDIATPGARSYVGTVSRDKGTTGGVSADQQVVRFFDRSENQPPLNPYHGRPVVDQTLGDQFGEGRYELNVGLQIRNLIRADAEQPWFTIILPLRQTDTLTITGTIWRYNRRLPTPTPYHAPSPYVTESYEEFYGQLQRYGESIRMESDFFHTPEGQQNFFLKLTGIASDMVEGIRFDVMRELLRSIDQHKRYYHNHTYTENPMKDIMMRVQLFATLNKAPTRVNQLAIITEKLERVLNEFVPGPYEMIVPPEWGIWMNKVAQTPVPQPYYLQGDDGGQLFIRNGPTPKGTIGRNNFWEYQDVTVETGSLPLRMLQRPVSCAEYYRASFVERSSDLFSMLTGLLASEKNVGRMRNIYTYSLTENKYIEVKIQDMIRASGIVPSSYSSSGNSDTREYRALVDEYKAKGTSARSKFYPDEKEHPSGQMNHANQREAPMFLAWEPKGDKKGNNFIRVKYSGETDENVTAAEDHNNQGQVICAHLVKTYGLDRIGAHYANAFGLRRRLQQATDSEDYWRAFYLANIFYSLTTATPDAGLPLQHTGKFVGSRLADATDYPLIQERWGTQPYDQIGELSTQPGGHYLIPSKGPGIFVGISVPPGCDCPIGIRSIAAMSMDSNWDNDLIKAVRDHEDALLSMVEMAKKLPESELVNPLNRDPWVHNAEAGAFATAYTNGVSQFRAPIFLWALRNLTFNTTGGASTLTIDARTDYDAANARLYARDPLLRRADVTGAAIARPPAPTNPRRAVDPVTGSLGADDEDEPIEDGMEPEETILQRLLRDYFIDLQSDRDDIDTSFEHAPNVNPTVNRGLMYIVTYFTNPNPAGDAYQNSYIRAAFVSNAALNTTNEAVALDILDLVKIAIEIEGVNGGIGDDNDHSIVYIGTADELPYDQNVGGGNLRSGALTIPEEMIGTVVGRAGNTRFRKETRLIFDPATTPVTTQIGVVYDGTRFTNRARPAIAGASIDKVNNVFAQLREDAVGFETLSGPVGATGPITAAAAGAIPGGLINAPTLAISVAEPAHANADTVASRVTYAIRCGLVVTPGMVKSKTYLRPGSILSPGNKATGYTTPLANSAGATRGFDAHGLGHFGAGPLVHGLTNIMERVGNKPYLEWETGTSKHQSHFGFNQTHARLAGMDDEGTFPTTDSYRSGYYRDDDEFDEDEGFRGQSGLISSRRAPGSSLLGSRRRARGSTTSGRGLSAFADEHEEGAGFSHEIDALGAPIGAREAHDYYDGARRRGRNRFARRPFAHSLARRDGQRFSEGHGRDLATDAVFNGKWRKGYRMVQRFNGSNFVAKMTEITSDPSSPCTFFAMASMMSRCDRVEHWIKLAKNRLHIASDFLLHRIVEVYAESALLLKAGLGFTVVNNADYKNGEVTATKTYHGHLTVHYGAFVTRPDYQLMLEDMRLTGYIGGKGGGMVMHPSDLDVGGARRGSSRPSFIVTAIPIAQKSLPQVLSLSGTLEMDDVLPENMPVQGALYGGVDWHNRRWRWRDLYNSQRNSRDYFQSKGHTYPLVSFQGWQANYDLNEGVFKVYSQGEGHLAGGDYPGAIHVVNGDVPYFDYPGDPNLF